MAEQGDDEADRLIARALESVLESVPDVPGGAITPLEQGASVQPWAETAAPPGRDKRPLEDLLLEYAARVAAAPDARAPRPNETHPAEAYLQSLRAGGVDVGKRQGKRRWHGGRRRGGGGGGAGEGSGAAGGGARSSGSGGSGSGGGGGSGGRRGGRRRGRGGGGG